MASSSNPIGRPQPTPRMTDSASGPNGPHSLAFASLSVQSYHLDSPPFTGTSIGSFGPLAQEGERLAAQERERNENNQSQDHSQGQTQSPTTPSKSSGKKATSPLSRAVKVDEMSRIVNEDQQRRNAQGLNTDQVGDNGSDHASHLAHAVTAVDSIPDSSRSDKNKGAESITNQGAHDRDVPRWQLDGTASSSSSSQSLSSQSQSQSSSNLTSNLSSTDSRVTSKPVSDSVSRGAPPFSSSGSGESSGISTPISNFRSTPSNSRGSSHNSTASRDHSGSPVATFDQTQQKANSGGAQSSMESNSHSHAGPTSPPIVDQTQSQHQQQRSSSGRLNGINMQSTSSSSCDSHAQRSTRAREDSTSRPSYTQLASQDSSSEHEGDGGDEADSGPSSSGVARDEEVDGDDTAFVIPHAQSQSNGTGTAGNASGTGSSTGTTGLNRGVPVQGSTKAEYKFPRHRLPTRMRDESKTPLVIVACGSFSPPTYLHLRIFEMAKDQIIESGKYELLGGYYSPVSDYYKKEGLAPARHRVRMCELAVEKTSTWLMVDAWESLQDEYQRTAVVLDHFDDEINGPRLAKTSSRPNSTSASAVSNGSTSSSASEESKERGGVLLSDGTRKRIKIMLLAGGDLIQSMGEPGVWASADLHHILGRYGCLIVERTGADVWSFLLSHDLLWKYRRNLKIVKQTIYNDISSSKVRLFVRRGQSIKYLLPNSVIHYIEKHKLYRLPFAEENDEAALEDENW